MLKNKSKIIAFLLIAIILLSATFVFADDEPVTLDTPNNADAVTNSENNDFIIEETEDVKAQNEETYKKSDVYLSGDEVTIDYIVDGNVFVCAKKVVINSQIGGDAYMMAQEVVVDTQGYIFSNLFTTANSVTIKGIVYDIYAMSNTLTIDNGYVYR